MPSDTLALAASIGIAGGMLLTLATIVHLVRLARRPELARAPVAAAASITLPDAGGAELAIEGPRFTSRFRGLTFDLVDAAGAPVALRRLWMPVTTSGFARTRMALYGLDVPRPGAYELRVHGIDPAVDYGGCAIVFVRPAGARVVVTVLALLTSVGVTAASIAVVLALLVRPLAEATAPAATARPAVTATAFPDVRDGRRLASDPSRLADAQEIVWPPVQLRLRIPRDWIVRKETATELDLRDPTTPSTFVVARLTPMPAGPTFDQYVDAHLTHARERLAERLIDGYATKRIGVVPGLLTVEHRDGGVATLVTWTGFQPAAVGSLSVTLLAGATADDFARDETLLGAIVDSMRFD